MYKKSLISQEFESIQLSKQVKTTIRLKAQDSKTTLQYADGNNEKKNYSC